MGVKSVRGVGRFGDAQRRLCSPKADRPKGEAVAERPQNARGEIFAVSVVGGIVPESDFAARCAGVRGCRTGSNA
jgi:hypothetical protein